ncbi:hypothetical protein DEU52_106124 [Ensifer adhaerens]|nr:hypothetical protein DEU52_106124 [Ensifer adhaerens]
MSSPTTSRATRSAISSPVSADGPMPFASLDGATIAKSGAGHAPVSRFRALDSTKAMPTNDTSGPLFSASSPSATLQWSLESKLRTRMDGNGSRLFGLIWKQWDMHAGPPICALRALVRRMQDNGSFGWQTPRARGDAGGRAWRRGHAKRLEDQARLFGMSHGLTEEEAARHSLSVMFCRRLMGYPSEWASCAPTATQSSRKSRQK